MRRRDFIALAGGLTAAWPLAVRAQQDNRVRHIGIFMNLPEGDPDGTHWIAALLKSLDEFGWTEGRNIRLDIRWGIDAAHVQKNAEELVALNPDVIVAASLPAVRALQQTTRQGADHIRRRHRSGGARPCREPGAAGRQRHGLFAGRTRLERQMAAGPQRDGAGPDAGRAFFTTRSISAPCRNSPSFKPRRPRLASRSASSTCATSPRSSRLSRPSRVRRMAD